MKIKVREAKTEAPVLGQLIRQIGDEALELVSKGTYDRIYKAVYGIVHSGEHRADLQDALVSSVLADLGSRQG